MSNDVRTVLITGFDPCGGERVNPSYEAVKLLPDYINGIRVVKKNEIPTEFYRSKDIMMAYIDEYKPEVIINVGQAGGRECVSIETKAYNMMDAPIPDNAGNCPKNIRISENGNDVLITILPVRNMEKALKDNGINCYLSESAGRYVCNYIMYVMLELFEGTGVKIGFVHLPFSYEKAVNKKEGIPFMHIKDMTKALHVIIESAFL